MHLLVGKDDRFGYNQRLLSQLLYLLLDLSGQNATCNARLPTSVTNDLAEFAESLQLTLHAWLAYNSNCTWRAML